MHIEIVKSMSGSGTTDPESAEEDDVSSSSFDSYYRCHANQRIQTRVVGQEELRREKTSKLVLEHGD